MLEHSEYMPLQYIKKQKFSGSYRGMRFLFHRVEEVVTREVTLEDGSTETQEESTAYLEVVHWKEPFSYECTQEDLKTRQRFPFSEEGREQGIAWLEKEYADKEEMWKQAMKWDWDV